MQGGIGPLRPSFVGAALPRAVDCHLQWLVFFEPPIFFSLAREKKTGRSRSKRKERFESLVENFIRVEPKREVQIDLPLRLIPLSLHGCCGGWPLRRTPLPLLRCLGRASARNTGLYQRTERNFYEQMD